MTALDDLTTRDGKRIISLTYWHGEVTEIAELYPWGKTVASAACLNCGEECMREEADVGVGIIYGPWGCHCGWSDSPEYNQLDGPTAAGGKRTDQWGWLYPTVPASPGARDSDHLTTELP